MLMPQSWPGDCCCQCCGPGVDFRPVAIMFGQGGTWSCLLHIWKSIIYNTNLSSIPAYNNDMLACLHYDIKYCCFNLSGWWIWGQTIKNVSDSLSSHVSPQLLPPTSWLVHGRCGVRKAGIFPAKSSVLSLNQRQNTGRNIFESSSAESRWNWNCSDGKWPGLLSPAIILKAANSNVAGSVR